MSIDQQAAKYRSNLNCWKLREKDCSNCWKI